LKYVVSVVPATEFVNVPAPSLPVIVTKYWSIGLLPGTAAVQDAISVSVAPVGSRFDQLAMTLVEAEGGIVAGDDVTLIGTESGLDPLMLVVTTLI
jgi:hypothetical protein